MASEINRKTVANDLSRGEKSYHFKKWVWLGVGVRGAKCGVCCIWVHVRQFRYSDKTSMSIFWHHVEAFRIKIFAFKFWFRGKEYRPRYQEMKREDNGGVLEYWSIKCWVKGAYQWDFNLSRVDLFLERVLRDLLRNSSQIANQRRAMIIDAFLHLPSREAMKVGWISENNYTR